MINNNLEQYIVEAKEILSGFSSLFNFRLSNRQVFSFTINAPILYSYHASEKFSKKILLDDKFRIHPQELPSEIDALSDDTKDISDKDYDKKIIDIELKILKSFEVYSHLLLNLLELHTKFTKGTDRYEILDKISRITGVDVEDQEILAEDKWSFVNQIDLINDPFDVSKYNLTPSEWQIIYNIPDLVFYLISAADGKISKKEKKQFEKFIEDDLNNKNPLISHIFVNAKEIFEKKPLEFEVGKHEEVLEEFKNSVLLLNEKLSVYEVDEISILLIKLAYEVAAASGFGGFGFVDYQESQNITEIGTLLNLSEYEGKKVKYGDKVLIGAKRVFYTEFFRMIYARDIINTIDN